MRCHLQISSYRIDLMSVNGPISLKQCYYEMDYSFYSFYWLDSLETRLDHNSTYYRSLSKNSDVKPRILHCDSQNLQYKTHPEFWPSHRRIFKTSLYYKTRLILETRRYFLLVNDVLVIVGLTHWGLDKMAVILWRMFSNSFSCKKIVVFCLQFHQKLLPRVWLIINQHWFR